MNIIPLYDRVVAEPILEESSSKIIVPNNSSIKIAKVVALGKDVDQLKQNDIIYYEDFVANKIAINSINYIIIKQVDIIAKKCKEEN